MFTSSIKSKSFFNGEFKVDVEFTDGVQTWTEDIRVRGAEDLNAKIKSRLQILNELETFSASLPIGAYVPTTTTVTQTQAEIDKDKWFRDFNRLEQLTKLNNLGALRANAVAGLDTLRATVSANFKQSYVNDM